MDLALAIGKERSIIRAQLGSKAGLRDRVVLKWLPVTRRSPCSYRFNNSMTTLEPTDELSTLKQVFSWVLEGMSLRSISMQLFGMGVPSPGGKDTWPITTLARIVADPVYAGRYYALKSEVKEPLKRKGNTYGKSSQNRKPRSELVSVPSIKVIEPPITVEQHFAILARLQLNQRFSPRNAKRQYLLRRMIICQEHGTGFHGRPHHRKWDYRCARISEARWYAERCTRYRLNGPSLEAKLWDQVAILLTNPSIVRAEVTDAQESAAETE